MDLSKAGSPTLRWGVLGAARITGKLVPAMRAAGHEVVAIGASAKARAESLADGLGVPRAYEGYAPVLADPAVDAVYLPLANSLHPEWLLRTAEAKKHCLCEKPLVLRTADARAARAAFARVERRLQEAFMWRHHPQVERCLEQVRRGELGELRRVRAVFSFPLGRPDDYRWSAAMGGGALFDLGCYGINAARLFFAGEPQSVSFRACFRPGDDGVDETAAGWLDFGEGRIAIVECSFASAFAQGVELVGTEGRLRLERPWLAVDVAAETVLDRGARTDREEHGPANAYRGMLEHFARTVRDPARDPAPAEDGLAQTAALAAAYESARSGGASRPVGAPGG